MTRAPPVERFSANEIFGTLFRARLKPKNLIQAFRSIGLLFRSSAAALLVETETGHVRFDLPVRFNGAGWLPPAPLTSLQIKEFDALDAAMPPDHPGLFPTIVDVAHRRYDEDRWALLYSCRVQAPDRGAIKRSVGRVKLVLFNHRHAFGCPYQGCVPKEIASRAATLDHDIVAVYASYFDQMLRDLSYVPLSLMQAEWDKALHNAPVAANGPPRHRRGLPWSLGGEASTITLSLDLRKSTFAMQQTHDRRAFAHWLEGVAELSREIVLHHDGIFDKFTGDGVICHLVHPERDEPAITASVTAAASCAVELLCAMEHHMEQVFGLLKFRSRAFGPAIGMALDGAVWSLDRDGKPVVVGPGIVNACRLNGGDAGHILMTNDLKVRLASAIPSLRFNEHDLGEGHKDFPGPLQAFCWRLAGADSRLGRPATEIQEQVRSTWAHLHRASSDAP